MVLTIDENTTFNTTTYLNENSEKPQQFIVNISDIGLHSLGAMLDPEGVLNERDRTNNHVLRRRDVHAISRIESYSPGWRMISMPLNGTDTAELFLEKVNCTMISRYAGGLETHIRGSSAFNFDILPMDGYYTYCPSPMSFEVIGMPVTNRTKYLKRGWNTIGSIPNEIHNASQLCGNITSCISIAGYSHGIDIWPPEDFNLTPGKGYFVYVLQNSNWSL